MLRSAAHAAQKARFLFDENDRSSMSAVRFPHIIPGLNHHQGLRKTQFCLGVTGRGCRIPKPGWQEKNKLVSAWQQAAGSEDRFNSPEV